jgi:chromatin structure-remodeling complex protein RSC7
MSNSGVRLTPASRFNSTLTTARQKNLNGVYDPHTNRMQYPTTMQPTHARWEPAPDDLSTMTSDIKTLTFNSSSQPPSPSSKKTIFTPVAPVYSRNFCIVDTVYENPPASNLGIPGPDGAVMDIGFNGLEGVSQDIIDELPEDCRREFEKALEKERIWKGGWHTESRDGMRRGPIIDKGLIS